jgi:3-dehydroquinate synthase
MLQFPIQLTFQHRVVFTRDVFTPENRTLVDLIGDGRGKPVRVLFFVDDHLAGARPELAAGIEAFAAAHPESLTLAGAPILIPGGETCKNDFAWVQSVWSAISDAGLDRHSCVLAVGGGALLDLVGFGAATAHRGIRHIRLPSTTLSQGDGGVGVKNGVNYFGKKNWVGSFAVPLAVVNDFALLASLPARAKRDGLIEAVKVSMIRDAGFFGRIEELAEDLARLGDAAVEELVRRSAELHLRHIATGGDPFELGSARPLDFGHWAAHKLEQLSGFTVTHGEAVAIGMAIDIKYSELRGLMTASHAERALRLIRKIGFATFSPHLLAEENGQLAVLRGLEEFREHLGGELTITLVPEIGTKIEVHEMDPQMVAQALEALRKESAAD